MPVLGSRSAPGLTLLELLVTLAICGIAAGSAVMVWPRFEAAFRLEAGLHQVAADLHDTRVLAVAAAARARVVFVRGAASYRLERADDDGTFQLTAARLLPRGVRIAEINSGGDLVFSARGNAENGTVVLVDRRGLHATLRLNQRGRVTVERGRT
jgi:prepilin-type N-terminal cleavage/methylation domain-containing protein